MTHFVILLVLRTRVCFQHTQFSFFWTSLLVLIGFCNVLLYSLARFLHMVFFIPGYIVVILLPFQIYRLVYFFFKQFFQFSNYSQRITAMSSLFLLSNTCNIFFAALFHQFHNKLVTLSCLHFFCCLFVVKMKTTATTFTHVHSQHTQMDQHRRIHEITVLCVQHWQRKAEIFDAILLFKWFYGWSCCF